jgi:hypothetical protein
MSKADEQTTQQWQKYVEEFKISGMTREAYSRRKHIQTYQLDYWRKKFSRPSKRPAASHKDQWIPLQISDKPIEKDSRIDLWVGPVRVEVKHGFDPQLLAEVLQAIGSGC